MSGHSQTHESVVHPRERILVLDFGSQYSQLIARRIRELGVYSEIVRHDHTRAELEAHEPIGLIFSGGPASVYDEGAPTLHQSVLQWDIPMLGICYGLQTLAHLSGGKVEPGDHREYGRATVKQSDSSELLQGLPDEFEVWMSHGDRILELPYGYHSTGSSSGAPVCVIESEATKRYGVQFHPEVTHTPQGKQLLSNFLYRICGAKGGWDAQTFIDAATQSIHDRVADKKVLLGLSGGVDSSVTAALLGKCIGDKLIPIFVDNGLLRKNEGDQVEAAFAKLGLHIHRVNAQHEFLSQLDGVSDPEQKRKIIGRVFIEVFTEAAKRFDGIGFLAQGTLYPDVIESSPVRGPSATIKSHHNVGGLPELLPFPLLEPLRELFKDEVRKVGRTLGLPPHIVDRHPFPGPGLAVRHLGAVTESGLEILRESDAIFIEELVNADLYGKVAQSFTVLLPVRSVGVQGDFRTYEKTVVVRSVNTDDFMTADFSRLPWEFLAHVATRIANEVKGVNRVVYDITSKPPATVEWE
ncbi:MAG: glutamine-hydrolyzing GMP synthase [bacterium]|nr:glutamine-hydrolyzing GMP synthase [bacterium]